ncbi:TPA: protease, partial [Enterobacter cloacae]|nr:protease [Enterobacter cloacae]
MTKNIVAGMMMAAFSGAVYAGSAQAIPDFSPESLSVSA